MISKFTRKDFLDALFSEYYKDHRGFILVKSFKRGDPKQSTRYFPNIEILAKEHYGEERDVYFGISPRERMKAEKEHIHYVVALWADLDIGQEGHEDKQKFFEGPQEAAKAIRSFPRAPSIIVESGRGAHLYWLLKHVTEVSDPERIERALRNINEYLNCDTDVSLDTVLRLPETVNTKIPGKPVNCEVKFINTNFRYSLQDFENLEPRATAAAPKAGSTSKPQPVGASVPSYSDEETSDTTPHYAEPMSPSLDDSLVLDETIIDELIDDISMAGSVVADVSSGVVPGEYNTEPEAEVEGEVEMEAPTATPRPRVAHFRPQPALVPATNSVLERLSSSQTEVEILLLGSETTITGVLVSSGNGVVEVEAGQYVYAIPLSSISFIKSKA
ncbi:MAG: hypothetical protein HY914_18555 [Desulfomonile tiedjei]|nr:hypothetical protein [Desulfomonile tiedjei]